MGKRSEKTNSKKDSTALRIIAAVSVIMVLFGAVWAGYTYGVFHKLKNSLFPPEPVSEVSSNSDLTIHFLDVGEGNAALLVSDGRYGLIDGGNREHSSFVVAYLKQLGVKELDFVVISHYDADHLSGVVGVLNVYPVSHLYAPDYTAGTSIYTSYLTTIALKGLEPVAPAPGDTYEFGSSILTFAGPSRYDHDVENDNSICVKVSCDHSSFFFAGDAERTEEREMMSSGVDISSDVLIVGHHGSSSSTSEGFFISVMPSCAVISCSDDNSYGHPSRAVIDILKRYSTDVYRTDEHGTIVASCTADGISWSCEPSDTWAYRTVPKYSADAAYDYTGEYILNNHSMVFHLPTCPSAEKISSRNRSISESSRDELIEAGYTPCGYCDP